jgi:DNA-directed RNA polymerase subunit beta'
MSGTTFSSDDIVVPEAKAGLIEEGEEKAAKILSFYDDGLISKDERRRKLVEI